MRLSEMLIRVTEYQPRGVIVFSDHLASDPGLTELLEELASFNEEVTLVAAWAMGMNWVLDALLNYGIPSDLELLPRGEVPSEPLHTWVADTRIPL